MVNFVYLGRGMGGERREVRGTSVQVLPARCERLNAVSHQFELKEAQLKIRNNKAGGRKPLGAGRTDIYHLQGTKEPRERMEASRPASVLSSS